MVGISAWRLTAAANGTWKPSARGAEAVLTELGVSRLRQASRTHLRGIEAYFLDNVEPVDLEVIERSCAAIGRRARTDDRPVAGGFPADSSATGERPPD